MRKRILSAFLCIVLLIGVSPALNTPAHAAENKSDRIIEQIRDIYKKCVNDWNDYCGKTSFYKFCGEYVNYQIIELGIGTSRADSNGGDGKDQFGFWSKKTTSPGGYGIKAYSSSDYSLKEALTAISNAYPDGAYNILISYKNGTPGHVNFIHAILDGKVYFSDSFSQWVGSTHYQEGEPIVCSISKFSEQYEKALGYPFIGAIHFYGKESTCDHSAGYKTIKKPDGTYEAVCKECGAEYPITVDNTSAGIYKVKQEIILCSAPYQEAQTGPKAKKNEEKTIIGSTINAYGNLWYKTNDGYWIYKDYLSYVSSIPDAPGTGNTVSVAEGTYYIEAYCGKVVEVADSKTGNKANVQIWDKSSRDLGCQKFNITKTGSYYTLTAVHSGKVIDVADGSSKSGTNIWQYTSNGTDAQKWQFEDAGDGYYYIRCALGTYMDVYDNGTANGTNVWAYRFNGTNAQKFRLVNVSAPSQPHTLTIKYNTNGGIIKSDTYSVASSGAAMKGASEVTAAWPYGYGHESGLYNASTFGMIREGYSFVGWSLSNDGSTRVFDQDDATLKAETIYPNLINGDSTVTLYAIWKRDKQEHNHKLTHIAAVAPTCTSKGNTEYWHCAECGKTFNDSGAQNEITESQITIPTLGHSYENGFCTRCGKADPNAQANGVHFNKTAVYYQGQYTDIPAAQWFTNSVANAFELGLMKGNGASTFNPYGDVTLAEAITMASRIHSIYYTGRENFNQSSGGMWYQTYLDYAYRNGIINSVYYNTDVSVKATRAQFAEILSNSLPDEALAPMNSVSDNAIPDVKMTDACAQYVYRLYRAGILTGGDVNGTFSPLTFITRAEAAAIISRMADSDNRVEFSL